MISSPFLVKPGSSFSLRKLDPDNTHTWDTKEGAKAALKEMRKEIDDLQVRLFAEHRQSLLIVLQATDTGGKDGTIKDVFEGVNAQGLRVHNFRTPSAEELDHDFLWRIHKATPGKGMITVFNRSHYEDVLVVRVKQLVPKSVWSARYDLINQFERNLAEQGTRILKFYLHISKDEQKERLQARLDEPDKNWKFNTSDLEDRALWDQFQTAFQDALKKCSTLHAPWYAIPANRKWARNAIIADIVLRTLKDMDPEFPPAEDGLDGIVIPD